MRRKLLIAYCSLLTVLFSCTDQTSQLTTNATLYVYRPNPSALIEFSKDFQITTTIPFSLPPYCELLDLFPSPMGQLILVELSCPEGQTVFFVDVAKGSITQPIIDSDSHFLAWSPDGKAAYLRVDLLGNPHIVRLAPDGKQTLIAITEPFTFDLAPSPNGKNVTFTFSRGLGQGSELWIAKQDGKNSTPLFVDRFNYISFARFSPDGSQIVFIKIPDTQTPFTVGELWLMNSDGSNAHKLADADAGHGYAANWSPDGKRIAFVVRENPGDAHADQSSEALISNIYLVDVESGARTQITHLENGRAETPLWSPDGNTLAFATVINDRIEVRIAELTTGEIRSLDAESTCCPAWLRK